MPNLDPPPRPSHWSFETDTGSGWQRSGQRYAERAGALAALTAWIEVCADNHFYPAVRLGQFNGGAE